MKRLLFVLSLLAALVLVACDVSSTEEAIQQAAEQVSEVAEQVADNSEEIAAAVEETAAEVVETAEEVMADAELPDEITVAYFLEWPTPNQVAQIEETYDAALGVKVNWVAFDTGVAMSAAMASGDVQIAYSQGLVPFANAVTSGLDIQMVGIAVSYAENDNCVGRADLNLTRDNITDLHGQQVAVPIGTVAHYKMLKELQYLGVDTDQLEMVDLAPADGAAALQRGDVAMSCGWGGGLARMKENGNIIMTGAEMEEEIGLIVFDVVSVTNDFAEQYPGLVTGFLQVTEDANAAWAADQGKLGVIAEAAGMEEDATAASLATFSFPNATDQLSDKWLGGTVESFVTEVATFFVEQGELEEALPDYSGVINTSFLEGVTPGETMMMMDGDEEMAEEAMADDGIPRGGTLVIGTSQSPRHLNPSVQSGTATAVPGTQLFASPLRYDENWNPQPYLAESWSISDDGLAVTLNLVAGATFHDGEAVTSEDVKFSIETVKANHPFQSMYAPVTSIDTPDDLTVVINLEHPHPAILLAMSSALLPIIPEHIYNDGQDMKTHPRNSEDVIGSGPFKLGEYVPGESIILERYEDFFIPGRPYLDRIVIKINGDNNSLMLEMENGDIDMMPFMSQSRDIARLIENPDINVTDKGYAAVGAINWLAFNTKSEILSNKAVRQAIAYATDRDFITEALHSGVSQPAFGPIEGSSPFANPNIEKYDLDLDKANALLDEAGYPADADGTRFSLTVDFIPGPPEQQQTVAEYLKSQLAEVGIDIEVRSAPDFPTWAGRISTYDFDLTMDVVFNWGDPVIGVHRTYLSSNIVEGVIWSNTQNYANDRVDELLDLAAKATDTDERIALYAEFQEIVADELPIYWINTLPYHTASALRVQNVPISIWGSMAPMDEVYLDQ
ncbi:MAG: peptide/nickel transport system substrate-binding protein [Candidatus Promineifilaceae bacterium]|jgi:peptide/nickel transport system substrate-binding protein